MTAHDPRVPLLTIDVQPGNAREVRVDGLAVQGWSEAQRTIGRVPHTWGTLGTLAQGTLGDFINSAHKTLAMSWAAAGRAIELLLEEGQLYWNAICGGRSELFLNRLRESLNITPMPLGANRESCYAYAASAPLIEVKCPPDTILPIELLPLGLSRLGFAAQKKEEVFQNAALLGGLSCRVRYVFYPENTEDVLPPAPTWSVPRSIGYLQSKGIQLGDKMEDFLRSGELRTPVAGPYPDDGKISSAEDLALYMLAPHLMEQTVPAPGEAAEPTGGNAAVHVQAHGTRGRTLGTAFFVQFERGKVFLHKLQPITVDLVGIQKALRKIHDLKGSIGTTSIFFNSCHAAGGLGEELSSFYTTLTAEGIGALVAPRDEIPAGVAVALAQAYYRFLVAAGSAGYSDGATILAARLQLLAEHGNPLGLIYTSYGNS
jgi:hypothetical protein